MELSSHVAGTIRRAAPTDAPALARLFVAAGDESFVVADLATSLAHGQLLVLDVGADVLGAAAFVKFDCPHESIQEAWTE